MASLLYVCPHCTNYAYSWLITAFRANTPSKRLPIVEIVEAKIMPEAERFVNAASVVGTKATNTVMKTTSAIIRFVTLFAL